MRRKLSRPASLIRTLRAETPRTRIRGTRSYRPNRLQQPPASQTTQRAPHPWPTRATCSFAPHPSGSPNHDYAKSHRSDVPVAQARTTPQLIAHTNTMGRSAPPCGSHTATAEAGGRVIHRTVDDSMPHDGPRISHLLLRPSSCFRDGFSGQHSQPADLGVRVNQPNFRAHAAQKLGAGVDDRRHPSARPECRSGKIVARGGEISQRPTTGARQRHSEASRRRKFPTAREQRTASTRCQHP